MGSQPILSTLGDVVTKEQSKREAVLSEMDDLGTQVMAATDLLGEDFASHVNDTTVPPLASVYRRRDAMLAIRDRVNGVLEERRMTMEKLYESAGFVRQEIGDLQDEEFSLVSSLHVTYTLPQDLCSLPGPTHRQRAKTTLLKRWPRPPMWCKNWSWKR